MVRMQSQVKKGIDGNIFPVFFYPLNYVDTMEKNISQIKNVATWYYLIIVKPTTEGMEMRYTINNLKAMVEKANEFIALDNGKFEVKRRGSDCYGKNTAQVVAKYTGGAETDLTSWGSPREASIEFYNQLKCICSDGEKLAELSKLTA